MKKLLFSSAAAVLLFGTTTPLIMDVDAKSRGFSSKSYSSGKSSYSGSSSKTPALKKDDKTTNNSSGSTNNSNSSNTNTYSGTNNNTAGTSTANNFNNTNTPNTTPNFQGNNYMPSNGNYSQYQGKSFFNGATGFATGLLTAAGVYLVLDSFNNDEPVYVNAETGEAIPTEQLESLGVTPTENPVTEQTNSNGNQVAQNDASSQAATEQVAPITNSEQQEESSSSNLFGILGVSFGIVALVLLLSRRKK